MDLESVGSTDPMLVDSDTASLDAFPTNVVVYDEPLPRARATEAPSQRCSSLVMISIPAKERMTHLARHYKT